MVKQSLIISQKNHCELLKASYFGFHGKQNFEVELG